MTLEEFIFSEATYLPLFVEGARPFNRNLLAGGGFANGQINLFTEGSFSAVNSLMLFVEGDGFPCSSVFPLYCHNTGTPGILPLFVQGEGENDGYFPANNSLMLFIKCLHGAVLPMYTLGGPQPSANASLNMVTLGSITVSGSLNLVVPNVIGTISGLDNNGNTLDLYTSGF